MGGTAGAQTVRNEAGIKVWTIWMKIKMIKKTKPTLKGRIRKESKVQRESKANRTLGTKHQRMDEVAVFYKSLETWIFLWTADHQALSVKCPGPRNQSFR